MLFEWKSGFMKSVNPDANPGSQRDTEPCLEAVNKNWSLYLNSCNMKKPLLTDPNIAVVVFITRWTEGPWTFCYGFSLQTQSILALRCLMLPLGHWHSIQWDHLRIWYFWDILLEKQHIILYMGCLLLQLVSVADSFDVRQFRCHAQEPLLWSKIYF